VTVLKLTSRATTLELSMTARPRLLTTIATTIALALAATATSLAVAPSASASRPHAPGVTAYGNDISWPQCPGSQGGYDLPGPMASASFVVLGLTDGGSFRANPCIGREVRAVKARHLWAGTYAISTYPTSAELARYGGTGTMAERLGRVGAAQAEFNLATMARVGLQPPMVWIDIEPRTRSPWSASTASNNAVIDGVIARYKAAGVRAGIYSYDKAWKKITGGRALPGVATWVPIGHKGWAAAAARCAVPSFAGTKPLLIQWTDGERDFNITCPGVTGRAARGNLLTPYLNVRLAIGSHGASVAMLQRRLGLLKADGQFGPATRARLVAVQRTKHLTVNGFVGTGMWRALGAGTGTYTPPVRGITRALFTST